MIHLQTHTPLVYVNVILHILDSITTERAFTIDFLKYSYSYLSKLSMYWYDSINDLLKCKLLSSFSHFYICSKCCVLSVQHSLSKNWHLFCSRVSYSIFANHKPCPHTKNLYIYIHTVTWHPRIFQKHLHTAHPTYTLISTFTHPIIVQSCCHISKLHIPLCWFI